MAPGDWTEVTAAFIDFQAERGKHVEKLEYHLRLAGRPIRRGDGAGRAATRRPGPDPIQPGGQPLAALQPGGVFLVAIREGVGERWEVGDSGNPYFTVPGGESAFRTLLGDAGLGVEWSFSGEGSKDSDWLMLLARKEL